MCCSSVVACWLSGQGLGLGLRPWIALAILHFSLSLSLSSLVLISAVNTIVFVGAVVSVSARREYLIDDVRNTDRGELNLSPQWTHTQRPKPHGYHFETCEMAANSETELLPATLASYYFPFFQYKRTISLLSLTCKGYDLRPISKPVSYWFWGPVDMSKSTWVWGPSRRFRDTAVNWCQRLYRDFPEDVNL